MRITCEARIRVKYLGIIGGMKVSIECRYKTPISRRYKKVEKPVASDRHGGYIDKCRWLMDFDNVAKEAESMVKNHISKKSDYEEKKSVEHYLSKVGKVEFSFDYNGGDK